MHLSDPDVGLLPTMAIVGAGIPVAVGAALTAQVRGTDDVAVAVFGDGATNIGAFHEGLNLAAIWKLPAVFVCENNLYGEYSRIQLTTPVTDLAVRAQSYDMPGEIVDGQQLDEVEAVVERAVAPGARRRRPHPHRGQDLPLRRALALRQGRLSAGGRARGLAIA